ncbi:MAG: DNA adenine methylase [Candidatus Margulisiibacteriota bacterium]|nr:MAG: DNA adenine methylase [Candidatus Margulisbacteria bacterium GWD2_39_127]OGI03718.1 MAG: DNA adenine methylase [Candidatus Margulisbacteria bacterium GWF2_38_17]OGI06838.1 MAG: DNA adenine methylase [Candidatus Margulisbacteria bacterium GWE2_39_32]PZM82162.1 MAG: DNA adenine methylase [Candidatus Margulisiibacteriota bacterium]HAR64433.1 DNA adenine methylase [Candidatus Margulisiibacteriota bacterium]
MIPEQKKLPIKSKPILKWAGGKQQLINSLEKYIPKEYGTYIEPFIGGGALFFHLNPEKSIIADSNPELINLYSIIKNQLSSLIVELKNFYPDKDFYSAVRAWKFEDLSSVKAAARTLYLNKTCFNGLYRVNKNGQFNVPYGNYKNPNFIDEKNLAATSQAMQNTKIILGDYKEILLKNAKENDLIFLDPPYLPISDFSDFKRYTKEQFYEEDHVELFYEITRLHELGCHIILTNSNHPLVYDYLSGFDIEVVKTKRYINCKGNKRTGEDIIVNIPPKKKIFFQLVPDPLPKQIEKFPATRYMGGKTAILPHIWNIASNFKFNTVLDLFSGSGIVSYMFKAQGKSVITNDYMTMNHCIAKALIENNDVTLTEEDIYFLISSSSDNDHFVSETFKDLYFPDEDNLLIDNIRANIQKITNEKKKAIATTALIRACVKKRPRGIFTYVGYKYDDGRKDLKTSFQDQFINAIKIINKAVFDNGLNNSAKNFDALQLSVKPDLVYMDPPYYSPLSDNEYVRRYHFVEGIARDWKNVEMQWHTKTKKFKSYPTPFSSRTGAFEAFDKLFKKYKDSILLVSYSSNSFPTQTEIVELLAKYKKQVHVEAIDHKYCFGTHGHKAGENRNNVKEYIFVGY